MEYFELLKILNNMKGYKCIFGAGLFGSTWAYDLLSAMRCHIDFYCDNKKSIGGVVKDGIKIISPEQLYSYKDEVLVFIAVSDKYQCSIGKQLEKNGIYNTVKMDYLFMQTFIESILEMNNQDIKEQFSCIVDDVQYLSGQFQYHTGYRLNVENPKTFNEKLQWLKLHNHKPEYTRIADKYAVKQFVEERIGCKYLNLTLGVWNSFEDINFEKLPNQFVLKCTHDSGSMVVCKDKYMFDKESVRNVLNKKMQFNYFWAGREYPYKNIKPQIIAEPYLENENGEGIIDYKFLCADGKVHYIFTCSERNSKTGLLVNFYKKDWTPLPFERHYHKRVPEIEKPIQLEKMIELAECLSRGLKFIRVDFYLVNKKIYFSEMTFFPGGGMEEFIPLEWDFELGKMIKLEDE